jgi:predicted negative regulator of RcsB-dependent stress response
MSQIRDTFFLLLLVVVLGVATWIGGRAYLNWQIQQRKAKAAVQMQELRQALVEYNDLRVFAAPTAAKTPLN